jgi:hypothetical protein
MQFKTIRFRLENKCFFFFFFFVIDDNYNQAILGTPGTSGGHGGVVPPQGLNPGPQSGWLDGGLQLLRQTYWWWASAAAW